MAVGDMLNRSILKAMKMIDFFIESKIMGMHCNAQNEFAGYWLISITPNGE